MSKVIKKRVETSPRPTASSDSLQTCAGVIEYAKSISKSNAKCIEYVTLNASQYANCSSISIKLTDSLSSQMTSTFIMLEGETKLYKNKSKQDRSDGYFLKIKVTAASPMLYQLLEAVYGNIKHKERIPNSLHSLSVETITEKTFKDESIFINKLNGAMVEYVSTGESSILRSIEGELEALSKRERQLAKAIITPVVFYRSGTETKITFALKKLIIDREVVANVIGLSGDSERVSMTENVEEDLARNLGLVDIDDEYDEDSDKEKPIFNV
ncbi:CPXV082 protein [Cowpox virus]|uniref:Protein OPG079 n=1 Tax=Cowpox virus TaxID=10243 RepID=U5T9P9_COWPX|nr:CPXV082 protein [Cowpox virus]AGY98401.1 CPXV082 protein [Cowpox virus]AGY98617.1 CPXV082 protein [Cowpox virus]AGY99053.1 CPXV082 protein [Cowpox virus]AGY99893.1 CPXV082 protein [Cowpox virus]